jgi:hypothetical protein
MLRVLASQLSSARHQLAPSSFIMAEAAASAASGLHTEAKLASLGYKLPTPNKPAANYIMCTRVGNLIYTGACRGLWCTH